MSRLILVMMSMALLITTRTPAMAVPDVLQYQGRLTDAAGKPLNDRVKVTFALYTEADGGSPLWTQRFENLALDNGRFNVLLGGDAAPFGTVLSDEIAGGSDLYLGIQVGQDSEMTPRQQIASVVYSLHAGFADSTEHATESEHAATADEVEGAPGVAARSSGDSTSINAGEARSVASVSITIPVDGYILVSGGATLLLDNGIDYSAICHANIGEELDQDPEDTMGFVTARVAIARDPSVPFHCQRVYEMEAGTYVFYLNVAVASAQGAAVVSRPSITALFVPNAYGPIELGAPVAAPATRAP